jgi:hypothetical protein
MINLLENPSKPGADFLLDFFMELSNSSSVSGSSRQALSCSDIFDPETIGLFTTSGPKKFSTQLS